MTQPNSTAPKLTPDRRDPKAHLRDLGCPVCNALPDEMCVTPSGKPRKDHKGREFKTVSS